MQVQKNSMQSYCRNMLHSPDNLPKRTANDFSSMPSSPYFVAGLFTRSDYGCERLISQISKGVILMTIQNNTAQGYSRTAMYRTQSNFVISPNEEVANKPQRNVDNYTTAPQSSREANGTSPAEIYEQMTGRTVTAGEPSYNLSQEQADDLKSRYDIKNITAEEYKSLMKELTEMDVVSKSDVVSDSLNRPIVTGIFESNSFKQNFTYDSFTEGNFIEWAENLAAKYDSGIAWILKSKDNLNDGNTNKANVERLQKASDSVRRTLQVLEQLK